MAWIYLLVAGIFEIGWPLGFKLSTQTSNKFWGLTLAIISMALSGFFLWLAQKEIPIGTAYAIWTGIGAGGTFIIGILLFKDSADIFRLLSFFLIIAGIIGLKLTS